MSNTPIQLGSLNFDDIKENLKSFLQNSDNNLDIDFEGSIANTVVDLLSYNTMYYAFYSNMLMNESFMDSAQRTESLISLTKPLGYVVSHKNASSVVLDIKNTGTVVNSIIPFGTTVTGTSDSINYTFTYVGDNNNTTITIEPNETKSIRFYQTTSKVVNAPVTVDYQNQKFDLNDKSIDPRTIVVKVAESDGIKEYTRIDNNSSSLSSASRVYYMESTNTGYTIYFGAPTNTTGFSTGRGVGDTEIVYVSYITANGSGGNNVSSFGGLSPVQSILNSSAKSSGGFNSPDLNLVKFAAPRNFLGGGRLVTVSDYELAIANTGLISMGSNPVNNISVYGSSSAADQTSGRILFSVFDASLNGGAGGVLSGNNNIPTEIVTNFAEEVIVGLTFEYREPLEVDITFTSNQSPQTFNSVYQRGFNQTFTDTLNSSSVLVETTKIPAKQANTTANSTGTALGGSPEISGKFDFKNEIDFTSEGTTFQISFQEIGSSTKQIATISNNLINYSSGTTLSSDNPSSGRFELDKTKFQLIEGITVNLTPGKILAKDELIVNPKIVGSA
mgnify:CR=1 FL=1|tara:strand:- start:4848 stop:6524 length:1677 start_codon:yes stop_codon:yes gene_type:complete